MRWMPVGCAADRVAHQRQQAGMPGAGTKQAVRMEAQARSPMSSGRRVEIDAADLGEIACRQRAGDRLGRVPPFQRAGRALRHRPRRRRLRSRDDRPVPIVEDVAAPRRIRGPRPASASRRGRRTRRSRSNNNGRGRCACSASVSSWNGQQILRLRGTGSRRPAQSIRSARSISGSIAGVDAAAAVRRRRRCARCGRAAARVAATE